jgi:hypothetical protein
MAPVAEIPVALLVVTVGAAVQALEVNVISEPRPVPELFVPTVR